MSNNFLLNAWKTTPKQRIIKDKKIKQKQDIVVENFSTNKNNNLNFNLGIFNINNYMKTKFDIIYENILQGMSPEEKEELGVETDVDTEETFDDSVDESGSDTVTIKLPKACFEELKNIINSIEDESEDESEDEGENEDVDFSEEEFDDSEEDNEVAEDSSFGEAIETEEVSDEKGKKFMNKASNKVGGKIAAKGGTAQKGKIPEPKADPEEVSDEKGKKFMNKASNKVGGSLTAGKALF